MAQRTLATSVQHVTTGSRWTAAVTSGIVAGAIMGVLMQAGGDLMPMVGALYGQPTAVAGWGAHLFHSVVLALVFAALLGTRRGSAYVGSSRATAVAGVAYGAVLWLALAGFVMPVWLGTLGVAAVPVPNLAVASLGQHLIYGLVLGGIYGIARTRRSQPAVEDATTTID